MENYSKSEILQMVEEEDVEFIRLQFTDMFGVLKNVAIPSSRLIKAMENRCTIDTASLDGFTGEEENDLYLKPDLSTFSILPWRPQQGKVARFLCDVCREDGTEIEDSPRSILKKVVKKAQEKGYTLVPLQVYFKGSLVKVEIGLARGKKLYDKRADIAKKDQRRELEKEFKVKNLY